MSWDVYLLSREGVWNRPVGAWNYTHNTNPMIAAALESQGDEPVQQCDGPLGKVIGPAWWKRLDGLSGPAGGALLHRIVTGLRSDPQRFRAMNPPNGWGNYDSLLKILVDMRNAVPEWPTEWSATG